MSYGLALRFGDPETAANAVKKLRAEGISRLEVYGPFPAEELEAAMLRKHSLIPLIALVAGVTGGICAYGLQYYTAVIQYPLNIGGRALHSWPAFIPVTFELTILFSACAIFIAFLLLNRLPRLHHPVFEIPDFERASDDSFFVHVEQDELLLRRILSPPFLNALGADEVHYGVSR